MLANPGEFRRMMYEAFWEGKEPKPPRQQAQPRSGRRGRTGPPQAPRPSTPPRSAIMELQREQERILAMQAEMKAKQ